jgi:hypothetical protein
MNIFEVNLESTTINNNYGYSIKIALKYSSHPHLYLVEDPLVRFILFIIEVAYEDRLDCASIVQRCPVGGRVDYESCDDIHWKSGTTS